MPIQLLPPDDHHKALAQEINKKLGGDPRVTFFCKVTPDGTRYGMVYQYMTARRSFESDAPYFSIDEIIADIDRWKRLL
jgi:hypothetical protein